MCSCVFKYACPRLSKLKNLAFCIIKTHCLNIFRKTKFNCIIASREKYRATNNQNKNTSSIRIQKSRLLSHLANIKITLCFFLHHFDRRHFVNSFSLLFNANLAFVRPQRHFDENILMIKFAGLLHKAFVAVKGMKLRMHLIRINDVTPK